MAFTTPEPQRIGALGRSTPNPYSRQLEHDIDAANPQPEQTDTIRTTPRKRRKYSASPQPPTQSRLRPSIKNTPKGKQDLMRKVERRRALLQQSTDASSGDTRLPDHSMSPTHHSECTSTEVSMQVPPSATEPRPDAANMRVHPIPSGSGQGTSSDYTNPNVMAFHPNMGWVWVSRPAVPMLQECPNEPGVSKVPVWNGDSQPRTGLYSCPSSTPGEPGGLPLASPFQPKVGRSATESRPMPPIFEDEAPVYPKDGGYGTIEPKTPVQADSPIPDEDKPEVSQDANSNAIESSAKSSQSSPTRADTAIANGFAKLESVLVEIGLTTGFTPDQILTKWFIMTSSRASDCRTQQFEHYTAKLKALAESASSDIAFETMICTIGRNIREDQAYDPKFFRDRLNIADEEIESQLKAYAYDFVARKSLPRIPSIPSRQDDLAESSKAYLAPQTPTPEPIPAADEALNSIEDQEGVDTTSNILPHRAFSEPQEVKAMIENGIKKKTESDQRINELKEILFEKFSNFGLPRLSKPPLQFAKLPQLLYREGWVLENWPEGVTFPCDVKAGKGIAGLSVPEQEALLKALRDPEFPVNLAKKPENASHPVIFGVPPSPTSQFTHGRLRILDLTNTNDRKGLPRRTRPSVSVAAPIRSQDANRLQTDRPKREESQSCQPGLAEPVDHFHQNSGEDGPAASCDTLPDKKSDASGCHTADNYSAKVVRVDGHAQPDELQKDQHDKADIRNHIPLIVESSGNKARAATIEPSRVTRVTQSDHSAAVALPMNDNFMHAGQLVGGWGPSGSNPVQQPARHSTGIPSNMPFQLPGHPTTGPDYQTYLSRLAPGQMYPVQFPSAQQLNFLPVQDHFTGMYYAVDQRSQEAAGPSHPNAPPPFYGRFPPGSSRA